MTSTHDVASVEAAKRKFADRLLSLPHVRGLGVGKKTKAGVETDQFSVKVYVDRKVDLSALAEADRVPPDLEGIPTDVEEIGVLRAR